MTEFLGIQRKKVTAASPELCPCGSRRAFADCCGGLIRGERQAETPEALMRSRFSAYALRQLDYVSSSWHSTTRPDDLNLENSVQWKRLEIINTAEGSVPDEGFVEFIAHCTVNGIAQSLHERSRFRKEEGAWRYLDGETPKSVKKPEKVGRNAPCPCGSGKKFKKCCG